MASPQTIQQQSAPQLVAEIMPPKRPAKIFHRLLRSLLWFPFSLVMIILLVEIVFYAAHIGEEEFLKIEPSVGFLHLENKLVTFRSEGFSQDRINSRGFRDVECAIQKPPGTVRIAILGDSTTEAFQVPLNDTFVKLLEQRLNSHSKQKFEVLNFGMSAFGTAQEYVLYLSRVCSYHPDITLIMYHIGDIDDNVVSLGEPNPIPRPYFSFNQAGALKIDWSVVEQWLHSDRARLYVLCDQLRRHSRIWGVLAKLEPRLHANPCFVKVESICGSCFSPLFTPLTKKLPGWQWYSPRLEQIDPSINGSSRVECKSRHYKAASRNTMMPARSPDAQEIQTLFRLHEERWKLAAALLHQLNNACKATNSRLVVAALPAPNNSIFYFRELRHMQEQAKHEGFNFINVHKAFPSLLPMQKSTLYYQNHLSKRGHRLVADVLYQQLAKIGTFKSWIRETTVPSFF